MLTEASVFKNLNHESQILLQQIIKVIELSFPAHSTLPFQELFLDLINLYEGNWPAYQKCQTGYHNLRHAIEVALVTARMAAGHNLVEDKDTFTIDHLRIAIAAALFHDSGYLKDRQDEEGTGGKYTFTHVGRSEQIARDYCLRKQWTSQDCALTSAIISATEFSTIPDIKAMIADSTGRSLARIVGTADLIAQMADVHYMENIRYLFDEFKEAYKTHNPASLKENGSVIYSSPEEMIQNTVQFYHNFVIPRLEAFGRQDKYLIAFFGEGRNPYMENIIANLAGKFSELQMQWRRIGDILQEFGLLDSADIDKALLTLKSLQETQPADQEKELPFRERFQSWIGCEHRTRNLGDVLIQSKAVQPHFLRCALIDQTLPATLVNKLSKKKTLFLLHTSILLHNVSKDPWAFAQILVMANDLLPCESSSILLADQETREMVLAVSTATKSKLVIGRATPIDNGLSGWVFLHDKPAIVDNAAADSRFDNEVDTQVQVESRSILAIPLRINGRPIGVLEFLNKQNGTYDNNDILIMTLLANVIASSLSTALTS